MPPPPVCGFRGVFTRIIATDSELLQAQAQPAAAPESPALFDAVLEILRVNFFS
jgi:hypothetical protein